MKRTSATDHLVVNALLRIERAVGVPRRPFEKPSDGMDFWVLELPSRSRETLEKWQARILPRLRRHLPQLQTMAESGSQLFLHVITEPMSARCAVFDHRLLLVLSSCKCRLEHGLDFE
jgi:hypothetical protein